MRLKIIRVGLSLSMCFLVASCALFSPKQRSFPALKIGANPHYFQNDRGEPFFWLGDTAWLLFKKLNREEAENYLEQRRQQGFNVIQVMLLHTLDVANYQGDLALIDGDIAKPYVTEGSDFRQESQYDYWDHVDYIIDVAAQKGIYVGLVPVWGSAVKAENVTASSAAVYTKFLTERFAAKPNIIWLNGGDTVGDKNAGVWQAIGSGLRAGDKSHLITFHPRGRRLSSEWFHTEAWLDFNMFQSGHRNYAQDNEERSYRFGPDNWRYVNIDYNLAPVKPTLDGEPSYEEIPQGLHDTTQPRWQAKDLRRYAYWSVFSGAAGFTYGHNSVMQFFRLGDSDKAYGAISTWEQALNAPGAQQMAYLKKLVSSEPLFDCVPSSELVVNQEVKFDYIPAMLGKKHAFVYTYTGRQITINMARLGGANISAFWYNPRDGEFTSVGDFSGFGQASFIPPETAFHERDWVLILKSY